ncbi:MAG: type I pullulanase [Oscillibacter sp.]|nr:type I pullulanase [Oscillibacter sp.]
MYQTRKQLLKRAGSAILALLLLITAAGITPTARAAETGSVESPIIVKNSDGTYNVTFQYADDASGATIHLRGDIPDKLTWDGVDMDQADGVWTKTLENIPGGTYEYKFHSSEGDKWFTDPCNDFERNGNSLLVLDQTPLIAQSDDSTYSVTLWYAAGDGVTSVEVMGGGLPDTTWDIGGSVPMQKTAAGSNIWRKTFTNVPAGTYEYKFVVNGSDWRDDPANPAPQSGGNSQLKLGNADIREVEVNGNEVTFRYYGPGAQKVYLAGTMNGWSTEADALTKGGDGIWTLTKTLAAGSYEYKFVINGEWEGGDNKQFVVPGLSGASLTIEDGQSEGTLPATLKLFDAEGNWRDVTPAYTLSDAPAGITLTGDKITVSDEYPGGTFDVTAAYEDLTSKVSVTVIRVSADDIVIKLHYHREDGNYDGWNAWIWGPDNDGNYSGEFTETDENGGKVITVVNPGTTRLGFIIRLRQGSNDWADKDTGDDRFINIPELISGTIHIYVESGVKNYTKVYDEGAVVEHTLIEASYDGDTTVSVIMTGKIDGLAAGDFRIKDSDIAVTGVSAGKESENSTWTYDLTLSEGLESGEVYLLEYKGGTYNISMPNVYSTEAFEEKYTYAGSDLGATWTAAKTTFRVWAPTAKSVSVKLYESGTEGTDDLIKTLPMTQDVNGTWVVEENGDLNGTYYTYEAEVAAKTVETVDPYARTTGVNGKRAMVIDLDSTDPEGWALDTNPNADLTYTDAVIYELHVRDLSSDTSSGISAQHTGKFLGLTENGTATSGGMPTGIDHIKDLGVTHIHLLPVYDFGSVDETGTGSQFNWGYDPVNYNVPEGSYSTDPYDGEVRVREMKQMVKSLHDDGISVIMDVVYNHVQSGDTFSVNQLVPGYFSRIKDDGTYSSNSGCGNDTASERSMVRKFIVDSVNYWADEYHIDGFRFDLVGLLDTETINEIVTTVHAKHPDAIFYGEGWSMSDFVTKENVVMATQGNSAQTPNFAYFSDNIRDALKGSVWDLAPGYVAGSPNYTAAITEGFMARPSWSSNPTQIVNYASCHDNYTLFDRLVLSTPEATGADQIRMNNLAAAIYLTAEGIPLMQAGEEMLRTKVNEDGSFNENSYNAPDSVNSIKWDVLDSKEYQDVYAYYQGLIAFRKAHGALRLTSEADITAHVHPVSGLPANVVAFEIDGGINGETAESLYVIFNPNNAEQEIALPEGTWNVYINGEKAGTEILETITDGTATVAPISALVLAIASADYPDTPHLPVIPSKPGASGNSGSTTTPGNSGSTSTDAPSSYPVETPAENMRPANGSVSADTSTAVPGDTVIVMPTPDEGFITGNVSVTDADGNPVAVKRNDDGTYSFTMPNSGVAVSAAFVTPGSIYVDLDDGAWYRNSVAFVINSGLMSGTGTSTFAPDETTNRGMIVTILHRLANTPRPGSDLAAFNDVTAGAYYADAVYWAVAKGVVQGYGDGTFGPGNAISRQDLAVMLWRYAGEPASAQSLTGWSDTGSVSSYAQTAMAWCIENGLINGSDGALNPQSNATRSQVAAIITRFCQNAAR